MKNGEFVYIKWIDSYGVLSGWTDLSGYNPNLLFIESVGKIISNNDDVVALAHNYSDETDNTPEQANGIMVIPKKSIVEIISFSSYLQLASKQMQQQL